MELVLAVVSVAGIISFAGMASKAIDDLKDFGGGFPQDATRDFLPDPEVTANLLTDVRILSQKATPAGPTLHIEYRAEDLII